MDDYMLAREEDGSISLTHWGIRGQKWGTRRYQNSDGSLTQAGRERYGVGARRSKSAEEKRLERLSRVDFDGDTVSPDGRRRVSGLFRRKKKTVETEDKKEATTKPKKASELSYEELKTITNRIDMERKYNAYLAEQKEAKKSGVRKLFDRALKSVSEVAMQELTNFVRNQAQKITNPQKEEEEIDPRKYLDSDYTTLDFETMTKVNTYLTYVANATNKMNEIKNGGSQNKQNKQNKVNNQDKQNKENKVNNLNDQDNQSGGKYLNNQDKKKK